MNARLRTPLVALLGAPTLLLAASAEQPTVKTLALEAQGDGSARLLLGIPGFAAQPRVEVLRGPDRVVVDLPGVLRGAEVTRKEVAGLAHPLVQKARLAQNQAAPAPITRLVLEVAKGTQVFLSRGPEGLRIDLRAGDGAVQAQWLEAPAAAEPKVEQEVVTARQAPPAEVPVVTALAAPVESPAPLRSLPGAGGTVALLPRLSASTVLPAATPETLSVQEPQPPAPSAPQASTAVQRPTRTIGDAGPKYTGTRMTIDLQNTDLVAFLRIIADTGKLNLVVDQEVQGTMTFKFTDTPWDQILDVTLKNAGLGKEIQNGVLRVAKIEKLQKEEEDRKKLEEARALAGDLQTITRPLSYAKVTDVAKIIKEVLTKRGSAILDERTNTLIITDLPARVAHVEELLQTLDVQIQQVQIEARVVEASKGWDRQFGAIWPTSNSGTKALGSTGPWGTIGGGQPGVNPAWNNAIPYLRTGVIGYDTSGNPIYGANRQVSGQYSFGHEGVTSIAAPAGEFWFSFLSNRLNLNVILQALEKESVIKLVSNPKVVTQNNKKATILSGEKIPYPAQQGGASGGAITVQYVEANLQLDVTPQVTSEGTIIMDLHVEKAEADFGRTVQGSPTIKRKALDTQVLVRDGGTAVLGGVYVNSTTVGSTGVPWLMKIPILGYLFKNKINQEANAELLIFITPRIVRQ